MGGQQQQLRSTGLIDTVLTLKRPGLARDSWTPRWVQVTQMETPPQVTLIMGLGEGAFGSHVKF